MFVRQQRRRVPDFDFLARAVKQRIFADIGVEARKPAKDEAARTVILDVIAATGHRADFVIGIDRALFGKLGGKLLRLADTLFAAHLIISEQARRAFVRADQELARALRTGFGRAVHFERSAQARGHGDTTLVVHLLQAIAEIYAPFCHASPFCGARSSHPESGHRRKRSHKTENGNSPCQSLINPKRLGGQWANRGFLGNLPHFTGRSRYVQGTVGAPLDDLWQSWGMDFPNHLKIDVDGLEDKIIAGAARTLQDNRLRSVLIEVSGKLGDEDPIFQQIIQAGFTRVTDFAAHSGDLLKGTLYEDSVNSVFVRGV